MKNDLITQLAEYGEQTRASRDTVTVAHVLERAEQVRPLPQPEQERSTAWPRIATTALAAAAIALIVVGLPIVFSGGTQQAPPATSPEQTSVSATPTTTSDSGTPPVTQSVGREALTAAPIQVAQPDVLVWDGPTIEWFDISGSMPPSSRAVHVSGGRFYLPGLVDDRYQLDQSSGSVWISDDGLTWEQYPINSSSWASSRHLQFHDMTLAYEVDDTFEIVDLETGLIATSYTFDEPITELAYGKRGIFVSTAGERKYTYEHFFNTVIDDVAFRESIGIAGIDDGIFYAGTDTEDRQWVLADYGFEEADFDVLERYWYSIDGVDWTLVRDHGDSSSGNSDASAGNEDFSGYVATDNGFFATAWAFDGNKPTSENVWYSPDGINWSDQGCCVVNGFGIWSQNAIGQLERGPYDQVLVSRPGGIERLSGLPADDLIDWAPAGDMIVGIQWHGEYPERQYPQLYFSLDAKQWTVQRPIFEGDMYDFFWHWNGYFPADHVVATDTAVLLTTFGHDDENDLPPWRWLGIVSNG